MFILSGFVCIPGLVFWFIFLQSPLTKAEEPYIAIWWIIDLLKFENILIIIQILLSRSIEKRLFIFLILLFFF